MIDPTQRDLEFACRAHLKRNRILDTIARAARDKRCPEGELLLDAIAVLQGMS